MRFYITQSAEREVDFDLFEKLAEILRVETGVPAIDAKIKMRKSYGILSIPDEQQARRISRRFQEAGLENFILREDELVELPPMELLNEAYSETIGTPELIAAGRVSEEIEETTTRFNALKLRFARTGSLKIPLIPIRGSGIEKRTRKKRRTKYYVDIFTRYRHWRIAKESIALIGIDSLKRFDHPEVYLTQSVIEMLQGQMNVITFSKEKHYERYLNWLFQSRYARQQQKKSTSW